MKDTSHLHSTASPIKGLASQILTEVIKADMSMHKAQIEAWKQFALYRPRGEQINSDIFLGFANNHYLALHEVDLAFHIKAVPNKSFWQRLRLAWLILIGRHKLILNQPVVYDICSASDKNALAMKIKIQRFSDGTIKASYQPADQVTENLMR